MTNGITGKTRISEVNIVKIIIKTKNLLLKISKESKEYTNKAINRHSKKVININSKDKGSILVPPITSQIFTYTYDCNTKSIQFLPNSKF